MNAINLSRDDDARLLLDALEQIAGIGCVTDEFPELKMREIARKAITDYELSITKEQEGEQRD